MKIQRKIGIGVIGCGRQADIGCFPWYHNHPLAQVAAVCSRSEKTAKGAAAKWGAPSWFTDYRQLLQSPGIDAVNLCAPVYLHREMAVAAARAGKHILCEKPMAVTSREAAEMIRAARQNRVILMVGFSHRFYDLNRQVKQMIADGRLGRLVMFHNRFNLDVNYEKTWFAEIERSGGGVVMDCGVHSIDLFRWLVGEVREVSAFTGTFVQRMEVEDTAAILLKSVGGVPGVVELSWSTPASENTVEIYGSKGTAVVDYGRNEMRFKCGSKKWIRRKNAAPYAKLTFKSEIAHFIECVSAGRPPLVTGQDGLASLKIAEAVYRSAREHRNVVVRS
ncbi:MAG: Gfo/Idh/MocA family oxidoreductase [Kiritimatiellae bacterium]|nr:Gfo/Idh/MocA family oxidoreductase [Kiritimatiellia bacterium]